MIMNQSDLVFNMLDSYVLFDAIALSGLYCNEVRKHAIEGRHQVDVINFHLEKDMNSSILRSTSARNSARGIIESAKECLNENLKAKKSEFGFVTLNLNDVVDDEIYLINELIDNVLQVNDIHIIAQKMDHILSTVNHLNSFTSQFKKCEFLTDKLNNAVTSINKIILVNDIEKMKMNLKTLKEELNNLKKIKCL